MRVLCDLKHPADVHFFRPLVEALQQAGDEVLLTSRRKDETLDLLDGLGLPHVCISGIGRGAAAMGAELLARTARLVALARRFRPHVMVARTGVCIGLAGRGLGVPTISVDDTEFAWLQVRLSTALATVVCTGMGYGRRFGRKQERFNAPPQLAYTHPARFTPDESVVRAAGLDPAEPYVVVRLKAWRAAAHDFGVRGPRDEEAVQLVESVARFARPVVSSERPLPAELARYANPVSVRDALHLLAFARLYVGEGSTMAAEAACLGVAAVFLSPASRRGYLDAMERRFGHVTTVRDVPAAVEVCQRWLADPAQQGAARAAGRRLVDCCDDPVEWLLRVVRRYAPDTGPRC